MQKYGLIGYPLKHSFSIGYFNEKFKAENIDAEYVNFEIPRIEDFMEVIEENPNLCGLNVTIPYKEQVIPYLDELDKDTAKIGAVNVIKIVRLPKGKIKPDRLQLGHHRIYAIHRTPAATPAQESAYPGHRRCIQSRISRPGEFRNRKHFRVTYQKGRQVPDLRRSLLPKSWPDIRSLVNCTPVGMFPKVDFCPDIPYELLTPNHLLYDLLYNPNETLFMKKGKAQGAVTKNGLEMSVAASLCRMGNLEQVT